MAIEDIKQYLDLIPAVTNSPLHSLWLAFDSEADTLTINFRKPGIADDSELTDDDVIVRYQVTVLHASKRQRAAA